MSIDKITSKIEGDARREADAVLDDAKKMAWEIVHKAEQQAKEIVAKAETKGVEDRDKQVTSRKAVAVIDGKNVTLGYKQKLIDQCFAEALEKVHDMDRKDYLDFLVRSIKDAGSKSGEIILSARDKDLGDDLLKALKKEIDGSDFVLSEEEKDISGGVILRDGSTYFNGSLEALVDEVRDSMTSEIAEILFGGQEN